MNQSTSYLESRPRKGTGLVLKPAGAWIPILLLFLFTLVGSLAGLGSVLKFLFPAGAVAVGFLLYCRYPMLYIGFTWWLWFLTPLLRRVADFHSQFDAQGVLLTAPYLVTALAGLTFFRQMPKASRQGTVPFVIAAAAVIYSLFIGNINNPLMTVARTLIAWLPPILFGFHLSTLWRSYPEIRRLMLRVFLWGVLVMGIYGVYQYMTAPAWDREWLINVDMVSFGKPKPKEIRVWSTMNSPVSFGSAMLAGLILLFASDGGQLKLSASAAGYLSFLLSSVRAAWGGWMIAIFTFITSLKEQIQIRLMVTMFIMMICVVPLTTVQPFSNVIGNRLETLTSIGTDSSFRDRSETYNQNLRIALSQALGQGLGSTRIINEEGQVETIAFDSGILDLFFTLGWVGAIPYLLGIFLLIFRLFQGQESKLDPFANACRSIAISHFMMLGLGSFMIDSPGFILWSFLGAGLAANKYFLVASKQPINS